MSTAFADVCRCLCLLMDVCTIWKQSSLQHGLTDGICLVAICQTLCCNDDCFQMVQTSINNADNRGQMSLSLHYKTDPPSKLNKVYTHHYLTTSCNGMGIDPFVDFPGEWALLDLGYTQPLQHFHSHLVIFSRLMADSFSRLSLIHYDKFWKGEY